MFSSKSTPRGLLDAEARPGSARDPVVEVDLSERVLHAEYQAAVRASGRGIGLARDVGRDPERDDVRDVAGDVDVAAADVERAGVDQVAVGVGDLGILLIGVVRVDRGADSIDGVSSGGVYPAAGVTWAAADRGVSRAARASAAPSTHREGHTLIQAGSFVIDITV